MLRTSARLAALALLGASLSGCVLFEGPEARAIQRSPEFKDGYSDGCTTASTQTSNYAGKTLYRDENSYRTDKAYRLGWGAGYAGCRPSLTPAMPQQTGPVADPLQNHS